MSATMTDIERRVHQMLAAEQSTVNHLLATEVTRDPRLVEAELAARTLRRVLAIFPKEESHGNRGTAQTA